MVNTVLSGINKISGSNLHIPTIHKTGGSKPLPKTAVSANDTTTRIGRYATGLERVPFDEFPGILHKDEAVLTARQSNALRNAGMLTKSGNGKPQLNVPQGQITRSKNNYSSNQISYAPQFKITVEGGGDASEIEKRMRKISREEQDRFWEQAALRFG